MVASCPVWTRTVSDEIYNVRLMVLPAVLLQQLLSYDSAASGDAVDDERYDRIPAFDGFGAQQRSTGEWR